MASEVVLYIFCVASRPMTSNILGREAYTSPATTASKLPSRWPHLGVEGSTIGDLDRATRPQPPSGLRAARRLVPSVWGSQWPREPAPGAQGRELWHLHSGTLGMRPHRTARPSAPRATLTSALQRPVLPACLHEGPQSAPEAHSSVSGAGSTSANASIPGTNGAHAILRSSRQS